MGVAPKADADTAETSWGFPLVEVDSLWKLRWGTIAERFTITPGSSLLNFHSVNRKFAPLLADLRRAGVRYVLTSHGQLSFHSAWHWLKKAAYLNFVNRGPMKAAGLHALTIFAARRMRFLLPGYKGIKLIQGNLVTAPDLATVPTAPRSDYEIPQEAIVLLFLGRLDVRVKGLDLLVEAFSRLPPDRFRLLMVGPDWQEGRAELEQLAERFGCRGGIRFLGPIYGEKKWSLIQMADVFVSPSRWEAFSIAQAEAMAVGLPVVTSTEVNLAMDLREVDAALLIPLAVEPLTKAIATLGADLEQRRALGRRGKAWMEANCNPDRAGHRFREFYQAILERTRNTKS